MNVGLFHFFHLVYLPTEFWNNTVSCLQPFFSQNRIVNATLLTTAQCHAVNPREHTLASFMNTSVLVTDCRPPVALIDTMDNLQSLRERNILSAKESYYGFKRLLYRLILNPTPELQNMIHSFQKNHFTKQYVFAIQIRTGGCLADYSEGVEMMSVDELERLPGVIVSAMASWNFNAGNTVLFLSTDSTLVEMFIKQQLGSMYTVITSNDFHRGHTKGMPSGAAVQSALLDLFLLSDSDALLVCRQSGFGTVARSMGRAKRVVEYKVTHGRVSQPCSEVRERFQKYN